MNLLRIAWRNVGRNRRRSVLSILAVGFATTALVFSMALQKGSYADMIDNAVHASTGHLQIQRRGYLERHELDLALRDADRLIPLVAGLPHVTAVAPRIEAAALVSKGPRTFGAMVLGVDPTREPGATRLDDVVREGAFLDASVPEGALLGEMLARNLEAGVGDEVVFLGQGADGSLAAGRLTVRGLFRFGTSEMDRSAAAAPLATIQEAFSMPDAVSALAVLLDDDRHRGEVTAAIETLLRREGRDEAVVVGWPELLPGIEQSIRMDWSSGLIMYAVLVLVVGFGIANTFLMAFMERIRECGVMLAVGMRPARLSWMLYLESLLLVALGEAAGVALGSGLVLYFQRHGITFGEEGSALLQEYGMSAAIHPQWSLVVLGWATGIVTIIGLVVAIYPAVKASRLRPVEALRHA